MRPAFTTVTQNVLTRAGWTPERRREVPAWVPVNGCPTLILHDAARDFLTRFRDLELDVPIEGFPDFAGFVHFDPNAVLRFLTLDTLNILQALAPGPVFPIGTTSGHTMFIFLHETGASYLLDMDHTLFTALGGTPQGAVEALCDGRNGRMDSLVLRNGRAETMICGDDERAHWHIAEHPESADLLPPVSLSPARRPPTWRALYQVVRDIPRAQRATTMVTCGGFTASAATETFFVAHCENSLYMRNMGGFLVSGPPPGLSAHLRAGEIIPYTPPAGWPQP